jgi:hypothetical protein
MHATPMIFIGLIVKKSRAGLSNFVVHFQDFSIERLQGIVLS